MYILSVCVLVVLGIIYIQQVEGYADWYNPAYDELRHTPVAAIDYVERPLRCHDGHRHTRWVWQVRLLRLVHSGVVVTLVDGSQWLMERHGDSTTTVVTNIADLQPCPRWVQKRCRILRDPFQFTVDHFWNASYPDQPYNIFAMLGGVNCHVVSESMWSVAVNYSDPCHFVTTAT